MTVEESPITDQQSLTTRPTMTDYEIAPLTGLCTVSQRALQPGEEFCAVLFETAQGFERRDYSLEAWQGPPDGYFSYWKSRVPKMEEKKRLFVDPDVMINLFLRLTDSEQEVKQNFRFVLALILMRKRLLKYQRTIRDGQTETWEMHLVRDQSFHQVRNPRMSDEQIEAVSRELGAILHGDREAFAQLDADQSEVGPAEGGPPAVSTVVEPSPSTISTDAE